MGTFARDAFSIGTAAVLLAGCGGNAAGVIAPPQTDAGNVLPYQHTFYYTGDEQSFQVPAGVRTIAVVARGAAGAGFAGYNCFGRGGRVYAIVPVRPGDKLYVFVGGRGSTTGGFNGGGNPGTSASDGEGYGGGGASDVRQGSDALKDRILIAGGGGGQGEGVPRGEVFPPNGCGGKGGSLIGGAGGSNPSLGGDAGGGGAGGTQKQGGLGGAGGSPPHYPGSPGSQGRLHSGGNGGNGGYNPSPSGYNDGGGGGGGGGGYYGGGGGGGGAGASFDVYGEPGGGGGGGASYVERRATSVHMWQGWHRARTNGLVVFSWR